jgi:hypothetical protein
MCAREVRGRKLYGRGTGRPIGTFDFGLEPDAVTHGGPE